MRRARRTAALARGAMALAGIALVLAGAAGTRPALAIAGFAVIGVTAAVQLLLPSGELLAVEESLAPMSAVLIVGLGPQRPTAATLLWLCCVACGVLARGGRLHWYGRAVLLASLVLPIARHGTLSAGYAATCVAAIALLLTCGRVTRELRAMAARARHEADHDGLTGALARTAFRARLGERVAAAAAGDGPGGALLLVDLDGFGAVNKSAGHAAGDALLIAVAHRLEQLAGDPACVGRLGGDEFAVVLDGSDAPDHARRVLAELTSTVAPAPASLASLSWSAGLARYPCDGDDADALLRAVDVALRVSKRMARHELSVYEGESFSERGPGGARQTLERLIAGDGLRVVVQPIVAAGDRATHAYEALARFDAAGQSSPLHLFALADEFGIRDRLEIACLRAALRAFPERPDGTSLSVNLTGALLLDPRVRSELDTLPGLHGLIIELTENSLLEDSPRIHAEISELQRRGARFAVDDIGAGWSGLRQLMTVRPSYLKLDRSLISGIDSDPDRAALVSAMLGYARRTGGQLVAEGVETEAELALLLELGVPLVQGFHLARPGWPWPQVGPRPVAAATAV